MFNETPVSLCRTALGLLGIDANVNNIEDPSPNNIWEKRCSEAYRRTLIYSLTWYMPTFAITPHPVKIPRSPDGTFKIPAESLKIFKVNQFEGDDIHEIGGEIICDYPLHGDHCEIKYVKLIEQTGLWSIEFQELFPYELAAVLAPYLSDSGKLAQSIQLRDRKRLESGGINAGRVRVKRSYKQLYDKKWKFPRR